MINSKYPVLAVHVVDEDRKRRVCGGRCWSQYIYGTAGGKTSGRRSSPLTRCIGSSEPRRSTSSSSSRFPEIARRISGPRSCTARRPAWQQQRHRNTITDSLTRHRASTSMHSLTFRVRATTPAVWTK